MGNKAFVENNGRIYQKLNDEREKFVQTSYTPEDMNDMIRDDGGKVEYNNFDMYRFPLVLYELGEIPTPEEEAEMQKMDEDI